MPDSHRDGPPRDAVEALVEEFFDSRRRGDRSDVDDFARRVPGREEEFRKLVAALDVLEVAAASTAPRPPLREGRERLGRFRLLRLVGRGGMGAVYEAIDEALGRHVALKVLPGHVSLDERELARFQREAQSAARLNHPHIVPLYGVGEDDGTHWLAMQFIDGESIDRLLQRRSLLAARDVARHGLAIADALAQAHAEGVLHRDVKPSNVLLDASGTVWITDFGLAKSEGTEEITRTGETVGTPRYMAPEAFAGWADPRTDVWGVGATLYEMLAGRPAFDGRDRAQLLKQIHDVEPPPLRALDPQVPPDLATIVTKCLQKEPAARYASARELADDLRSFLDGQPIRARPPTLAYRLGLIARRHRVAFRAGVAIAAGFVVVLVAWAVTLAREKSAATDARRRAEKNLATAMSAIDRMLTRVGENGLLTTPGFETQRAALLNDALALDLELLAQEEHDPSLRLETANARRRAATLHRLLGHLDDAADVARAAAAEYAALLADGADEEVRHAYADVSELLVEVELDRGRLVEAEAAARAGADAAALHVARAPACAGAACLRVANESALANVLFTVGRGGEVLTRFEPIVTELDRALGGSAPIDELRALSNSWQQLSQIHAALGRRDEALREARRSFELDCAIDARPERSETDRTRYALSTKWLGEVARRLESDTVVVAHFREAETILEEQYARMPGLPQLRAYLVGTLDGLALVLLRCGDLDGARAKLERAVALADGFRADGSSMFEVAAAVAARCDLGHAEEMRGALDAADARFRSAIEVGEARLAKGTRNDQLARNVATAHRDRAVVARTRGDFAEMEREAAAALTRIDAVARLRPGDVEVALEKGSAESVAAEAALRAGRPHDAVLGFERAGAAFDDVLRSVGGRDDEARSERALNWVLLGNARRRDGDLDGAAQALARSEEIDRALQAEHPDDAAAALALATTLVDFALLQRVLERHEEALVRDVEALRLTSGLLKRGEVAARAHAILGIALNGIVADLTEAEPTAELDAALAAAETAAVQDDEARPLVAHVKEHVVAQRAADAAAVTDPERR